MVIKTKALIIREQSVGESDRLVTLLSGDLGIIKAFVKRAKVLKNSLNAATSLFAYCNFTIYKNKTSYNISSAEIIEIFFDLRRDIETLSLAQYIAQMSTELVAAEQKNDEMLSLVLNSLYLLCKGNRKTMQIKAAFEIKALSLAGYMPSLVACENCGAYESDNMYFDISEGTLYCQNCAKPQFMRLTLPVVKALRLICFGEKNKMFSFSLSDSDLRLLANVAEKYTLSTIDHKMGTLDFYKGISNGQKF